MVWTAPSSRRLGLAKELLSRLGIARAYTPSNDSLPFWRHLGIPFFDSFNLTPASKKEGKRILFPSEM